MCRTDFFYCKCCLGVKIYAHSSPPISKDTPFDTFSYSTNPYHKHIYYTYISSCPCRNESQFIEEKSNCQVFCKDHEIKCNQSQERPSNLYYPYKDLFS